MLDSSKFIRSIGGFVITSGDFEPFTAGEYQIAWPIPLYVMGVMIKPKLLN